MTKKTGHASHDKIKAQAKSKEGRNFEGVNVPLKQIFADYMKLEDETKAINKAKRDLRAKAKEEHEILSSNFQYEVKMMKLDPDQRIQFESGIKDLKEQLGYQMALGLVIDRANAVAKGERLEKDNVVSTNPAAAAKEFAEEGKSAARH